MCRWTLTGGIAAPWLLRFWVMLHLLIFVCLGQVQALWHMHRGQRTTLGNQFSPFSHGWTSLTRLGVKGFFFFYPLSHLTSLFWTILSAELTMGDCQLSRLAWNPENPVLSPSPPSRCETSLTHFPSYEVCVPHQSAASVFPSPPWILRTFLRPLRL